MSPNLLFSFFLYIFFYLFRIFQFAFRKNINYVPLYANKVCIKEKKVAEKAEEVILELKKRI